MKETQPVLSANISTREVGDVELASFTQNIVQLESILFRANQELTSQTVNVDRLKVYLSEMFSIRQELKDQQARAVAARGVSADDVVRLQGLLSGPLTDMVTAAERHINETQAKLDALLSGMAPTGAPPPPPVDISVAQGDDGEMEARITKLEADLTAIKIDVGVIKANGASKSDIAELKGATKADLAELRGSVKADIEGVKASLSEAKTSIILWVVVAVFLAQLLPMVKEFVRPMPDASTASALRVPAPAKIRP